MHHCNAEESAKIMMKRAADQGGHSPHKKHKSERDEDGKHTDRQPHRHFQNNSARFDTGDRQAHKQSHGPNGSQHSQKTIPGDRHTSDQRKQQISHSEALAQLPPPTEALASIPAYTPFTVSHGLPSLPDISMPNLVSAPFKHKSLVSYDRSSTSGDISYERLEFLGDAYIELVASRLIFSRFPHLPAGQQSQLRELLVKNETLAEYSRAYGFDQRVEASSMDRMMEDLKVKGKEKWNGPGNKGFNKILGDVFEAYVAAVILSDAEEGFAIAEKWLTALWAPKLIEATKSGAYSPATALVHDKDADPLKIYNPNAKQELQKRIMAFGTKLDYEKYQDPVELKGEQLGQNRHFIALYLTGHGYERKLLDKGEGKNKVEAGNWAATKAMYGECKGIVVECEKLLTAEKERKRAERAAEELKGDNS